ncbi:ClpXP protease specificity-enhancing factor [Halochromatium salexigens]|uniref:ClpXP protease specificity-enhancing factor n=1 Tax=Halochromatium salexigens TaxID=49447 RepID=A0AAJ0UIE0_HALSE|nr:ClpXP protease specificity-enhancing factor [Halochromatium salexigens]MBK5932049.1 ClpXP protease specificity-enhancing factor [Halochromatium salexigens]
MTSNRPYLIRAFYEWIADNEMTPHLLVDTEQPDVIVPRDYVADGRIVLNVAASAVQGLVLGNEAILFSARFGGRPFPVELPIAAVVGIYARENGQGMLFADEDGSDPASAEDEAKETGEADAGTGSSDGSDEKVKRPALRVVK